MMDSCRRCGAGLPEGAITCPACGEDTPDAQPATYAVEAADPGWWWEYGKFVLAGSLVLLIICTAVLLLGFAMGPRWFSGEDGAPGAEAPEAGTGIKSAAADGTQAIDATEASAGAGEATAESAPETNTLTADAPEEVVADYFRAMETEDVDLLMSTISTASLDYMEGQLDQINQEMESMREELESSIDAYATSPGEYDQLMAMLEGFPCVSVADLFRQSFSFSDYRFEGVVCETVYEREDRAMVTVVAGTLTSTFQDGETQTEDVSNAGTPLRFALFKEDGRWGIDIEASDMLMSESGG